MTTPLDRIDPLVRDDWDSEPIDLRVLDRIFPPRYLADEGMVEPIRLIGFQFRDLVLLSVFLVSAASLSIPDRLGWEVELIALVATILFGSDILGEKRLSKIEAAIAAHLGSRRDDQIILIKNALLVSNKTAGQVKYFLIVGHLALLTVGFFITLIIGLITPSKDFDSVVELSLYPLTFATLHKSSVLAFSVSWILFFTLLKCPSLESESNPKVLRRAARANISLALFYSVILFALPTGCTYVAKGAPPLDRDFAVLAGFNIWLYLQAGCALSLHLKFLERQGEGSGAIYIWIGELLMLSQYILLFRLPFTLLPTVALLSFYTLAALYFRLCLVVLRVSALRIAGLLIIIAVGVLRISAGGGSFAF